MTKASQGEKNVLTSINNVTASISKTDGGQPFKRNLKDE